MSNGDGVSALLSRCRFIDLSPVIDTNMPRWPSHPDVALIKDARTRKQHGYFAQTLILPEHCGSHVDAPAHLADAVGAITVDKLAVDALIGPAKKIDASGENLGPGDVLSFKRFQQLATASGLEFGQGDVALFEFGWDRYFYEEVSGGSNRLGWWGSNEPGLDEEICRYLSNKRVRAVGSDTAGCDIAEIDGRIVSAYGHEEWLLPKGVLLIEGLQGLSDAPAEFVFVALPLRIAGGSGSPVRAIGIVAEAMDCGAQERVTEAEGLKATP